MAGWRPPAPWHRDHISSRPLRVQGRVGHTDTLGQQAYAFRMTFASLPRLSLRWPGVAQNVWSKDSVSLLPHPSAGGIEGLDVHEYRTGMPSKALACLSLQAGDEPPEALGSSDLPRRVNHVPVSPRQATAKGPLTSSWLLWAGLEF